MHKVQIVFAAATLMMTSVAKTDPRVTYVGDGRYSCSGNTVQCAQVDTNNRQREALRDIERQREVDRTKRSVEENRKREEETKRRY
jgi:hypothetical protein